MDSSDGFMIDQNQLERAVALVLDEPQVRLGSWEKKQLSGGLEEFNRLYLLSGLAHTPAGELPWSLVLKTVSCDETTDFSPQSVRYWQREALFYKSGLIENLSCTLVAPRCYQVTQAGDVTSLWLEALHDDQPRPWPLERYREAARCMGCFNGAYLVGRPLPDEPWLTRRWLRNYVEMAAPMIAELDELRKLPFFQATYPLIDNDMIRTVWARRDEFFSIIERMPQVYCHLDAFEGNLFWRTDPGGAEQLVGLDWAFTGIAALGEELAPLIAMAFNIPVEQKNQFFEVCLEGYLAGLADAGYAADPLQVRFTCATALFYRYFFSLFGEMWPAGRDERSHPQIAALFGMPKIEYLFGMIASINPVFLDTYHQAAELLPQVA